MKQRKQDRRSRRTYQLLGDALVLLMREQRYDAITVQAILDRADVGRSTFYAHFYDKDDLLVYQLQTMLESLSRQVAADGDPLPFPSGALFRHVGEFRELYQVLKRANHIDLILTTFEAHLVQDVALRLGRLLPPGQCAAVPLSAVAAFVAGSFLTLLRWWLDTAPEHTPDELDGMFRALVLPAVGAVVAG